MIECAPRTTRHVGTLLSQHLSLGWQPRVALVSRSASGPHSTAASRGFVRQQLRGNIVAGASSDSDVSTGYWTLAQPHQIEVEIKKSKFLVYAWPVDEPSQAQKLMDDVKDLSASHNCWAYKIGLESRSSDDGEPSGTAGRPMLNAIEHSGMDGVCVLITRYFGGIKLGAGGLVRAYGGCAQDCLRTAPRVFMERKAAMTVEAGFDAVGIIYGVLHRHAASNIEEHYTAGGRLKLTFQVAQPAVQTVQAAISDATSGAVVPQLISS